MPRISDKTQKRFGRLLVLRRNIGSQWVCQCDCGKTVIIHGCNLTKGASRSCGCLRKELASKRAKTHGKTSSREYSSWNSMKVRCYNSTRASFKDYGGRGIQVCKRWRNSFEAFLSDMGNRPSGTTLERIDTDKNYSPSNCKWATRIEQNNNSRQNVLLRFKGRVQTVAMWARETGIKPGTIRARIARGWTVKKALCLNRS